MTRHAALIATAIALSLNAPTGWAKDGDSARVAAACNNGSSPNRPTCAALCKAIERAGELEDLDNAMRGTCMVALRSKEAAAMPADKACGPKTCVIKLRIASKTRGGVVLTGSGYTVTYATTDTGRAIRVKDPGSRISRFSQCGTCRGIDHESGPLKAIEINAGAGDTWMMQVPR